MDALPTVDAKDLMEEKTNQLARHLKFIALDPENLSLVIATVELAIDLQNWDIAQEIITRALVTSPESAALNAHAGYISMVQGKLPEAIAFYNAAIAAGDTNPIIYFNLAQTYLLAGNVAMSGKTLGACPEIEQQVPQGFLLLSARLNHHGDQSSKSIQQLTELHDQFGATAESAGLLSLILFEEGQDYELAQKLANEALAKNPLAIEALLARTSLNLESGDYNQALADITHAVERYPTHGRAWSSLALVEFNNMQFESASSAAEKAVEFMPDHIGTWHLLGWAYVMQGKFELALEAFKQAHNLDRRFAATHAGLAAAYAHLNEIKLANNHIKLADKLDPNGLAAMYAKMVLLNRDSKHAEAQNLFEKSKQYLNDDGASMQQLIDKRIFELAEAKNKQTTLH